MGVVENLEQYRYDSVAVAKYIAATANERHIVINITKIQKLLYIAYGCYLAIVGTRLTNEYPQAWPYGPVFPRTRANLLNTDLYSISKQDENLSAMASDDEINALMNLVFRGFGTWNAKQLTAWSHKHDSPWEKTTTIPEFSWGATIPDEYTKEYFRTILVPKRNERAK